MTKQKFYSAEIEKLARYSKALGHPARVFIINYLAENADTCCYSGDLAEILPIARSTLSEHLKELKNAGLIQGEINPPFIKYCLNKQNWEEYESLFRSFLPVKSII
ncbi:MAG TPA: ArsR family transcriptional regulator [Bacteroidales bacterium]|nr:ArsR family transcriptional regulator [Bacteroidales bacterium]